MKHAEDREEEVLGRWIGEAGNPGVLPDARYARRLREMVFARARGDARPAKRLRRRVVLCLAARRPW